jgi:hypothetical protein
LQKWWLVKIVIKLMSIITHFCRKRMSKYNGGESQDALKIPLGVFTGI